MKRLDRAVAFCQGGSPVPRGFWVLALWTFLCALFFWEVLTSPAGQIVGGNDLANMFQPWLEYARDRISAGELPLWNPYLFSGVSIVSDPQPALFYPPTWLSLIMPATRALGLILVLHVWWAALGMTGWLRSEGASWWGAIAGAAVFAFSGYTFARLQAGHLGVLTTGAWLPWGLWALGTLRKRPAWRTVAAGSLCVGMSILAGHTATFVYVAVMLGAYALHLVDWNDARRFLLSALVMGVSGVALAAVQLVPLLVNLASSSRAGTVDYEFASRFSWPVSYLVTLLVPNFFGEPVRTGYWGEGVYDELIFYVGILPLMLAAIAWREGGRFRFWFAVSGAALLVAFGSYGAWHRILVRVLPLFSSMRAPARAGFLVTLGAAVLSAMALTSLERAAGEQRRRLLAPFSQPWVGSVFGFAALITVAGLMMFAWGRDSNPEAGRLWHLAGQAANFGLFFALAAGLLRSWAREGASRWLPMMAAGLILLDLWTLGAGLVQMAASPPSAYWRIVAEYSDARTGRVLPWGLGVFEQNGALTFRVRSVFGYNPLVDNDYEAFVSAVPDPRAKTYDLLNAAYLISKSPLELAEDDVLAELREESGVYIYERTEAMPPVWMVAGLEPVPAERVLERINDGSFDPWQSVLVEPGVNCPGDSGAQIYLQDYGENRIVARAKGGGGMAVFSEPFAPGWRVLIDGSKGELLQVDGILRGVCVPAGEHLIDMRYWPDSLTVGAAVSISALAWLLFLTVWSWRRS